MSWERHSQVWSAIAARNLDARPAPGRFTDAGDRIFAHALAGYLRHHYAILAALRAASFGSAGHRSGQAPGTAARIGRPAAGLFDGRLEALSIRFAHAFRRVLRQWPLRIFGQSLGPTPQASHGLASCSEWTGVPVTLLLKEAGLKPEAKWIIAEGADACHLDAQHPHRQNHGRRADRVCAERRAAPSRAGLSRAPAAARLGGQYEH